MSAPLTKSQKSYLAQLSARACRLEGARARGRGEEWTTTEEAFRHEHVALAAGRAGLRCCSQDDYKRIEAYFLDLLNQPGRAFNAHVKAETEKRRVAEWKVRQACREFGFHISYAEKICRDQNNGKGLQDVGEKALWNVTFTIRNRGRSRRKSQLTA